MHELYLSHNKDTALVKFLYNSIEDVDPVAIESDFNGENEIRRQEFPKVRTCLQIPIYNVDLRCNQIWVRNIMAYHTIEQIYQKYPNVSDYIFKITRYGNTGDPDTRYKVECLGREEDLCDNSDTSPAV